MEDLLLICISILACLKPSQETNEVTKILLILKQIQLENICFGFTFLPLKGDMSRVCHLI